MVKYGKAYTTFTNKFITMQHKLLNHHVIFFTYMRKLYTYVEKLRTDAPKLVIDDLYIKIDRK